jgi:hypothetical protein
MVLIDGARQRLLTAELGLKKASELIDFIGSPGL